MAKLNTYTIGETVKFGTFLGAEIEWLVADKNHAGFPDDSLTLIAKNVLAVRCFDGKESGMPYGNGNYELSNVRQWLNSSAGPGEWYSPQHTTDAPPSSANTKGGKGYDTKAGFLNEFTAAEIAALNPTTRTIYRSSGNLSCVDKVWLPTFTEYGGNQYNKTYANDGTVLSIFSSSYAKEVDLTPEGVSDCGSSVGSSNYWTASSDGPNMARIVQNVQITTGTHAYYDNGVRPAINISGNLNVVNGKVIADPNYKPRIGDLPIGATGKFGKYLGSKIEWIVADKNHPGFPENSVTLVAKDILNLHAFDGKEENNTDSNRKSYGNNDYTVSNIRQWLNSSADAGQWYSPQHSSDAPPSRLNVKENYNPYDDEAGFLNEWNPIDVASLIPTERIIGSYRGNGTTCTDTVWLPTSNEFGITSESNNGTQLAYFTSDASRIAYPTQQCVDHQNFGFSNNALKTTSAHQYVTATSSSASYNLNGIRESGSGNLYPAAWYSWPCGIRPAINVTADLYYDELTGTIYADPDWKPTLGDLPIGKNVTLGTFLSAPISWTIADHDHEGFPENSTALVAEKLLSLQCFDAKEPNSSDNVTRQYGNSDYALSNIRQWMNSSAGAGQWYNPQHASDEPPTADYVSSNPYLDKSGFLNGFSISEINALMPTERAIGGLAGNTKSCRDRVWLPTTDELGVDAVNDNGTLLSYFSSSANRTAYPTEKCLAESAYTSPNLSKDKAWYYYSATSNSTSSGRLRGVSAAGTVYGINANDGSMGFRPAICLSKDTKVNPDGTLVLNAAPTAPTTITVPDTAQVDMELRVDWEASVDPEGGSVTYTLERKYDNTDWLTAYSGSERWYVDTISNGHATVQYRVKATDPEGTDSAWTVSLVRNINPNHNPKITGETALGFFDETPPVWRYTVTDADQDDVTVTEYLDGKQVNQRKATLDEPMELTIDADAWRETLNGSHTFRVDAYDEQGGTATLTASFVKSAGAVECELDVPMDFADMPTRATVNVTGAFAEGSTLKVEICNNAFDDEPTWEDMTAESLKSAIHYFDNGTKTADTWGVNVRVTLTRGEATGDCYITEVNGYIA